MSASNFSTAWMVERQAFGGQYWERTTFGPFATREEADAFAAGPYGGYVYDAARKAAYAR